MVVKGPRWGQSMHVSSVVRSTCNAVVADVPFPAPIRKSARQLICGALKEAADPFHIHNVISECIDGDITCLVIKLLSCVFADEPLCTNSGGAQGIRQDVPVSHRCGHMFSHSHRVNHSRAT